MVQAWDTILDIFLNEFSFSDHQLTSYNHFLEHRLTKLITKSELVFDKLMNVNHKYQKSRDGDRPYSQKFRITFDNVYLKKPEIKEPNGIIKPLKPYECRNRKMTYSGQLMCDLHIIDECSSKEVVKDVYLGNIPIMIKSKWCYLYNLSKQELIDNFEDPDDIGGYFIINGNERVLISQDRMAHNENFIFKLKDTAKKNNQPNKKQKNIKKKNLVFDWNAEIRSYNEDIDPNISTTSIKMTKTEFDKAEYGKLYVELPLIKEPIPWPVIFYALNICDKDKIIEFVCHPDDHEMIHLLQHSLQFEGITNQLDAIEYISKFAVTKNNTHDKIKHVKLILKRKLFQNITDMRLKRFYLGYVTHQLLATILGRRSVDDRDHYSKKRVDTSGGLLNLLFKSMWKQNLKNIRNLFEKKRVVTYSSAFYGKITDIIHEAFAKGSWTGNKISKNTKEGVCQLLNSLNRISKISNLRRIKTPAEKNNKVVKPRHAHSSHFGYICPAETPEGQETGLLRNLALFTKISLPSPEEPILDWLRIHNYFMIHDKSMDVINSHTPYTRILVNGKWVAITKEHETTVKLLKELRKEQKIPLDTSISLTEEGIRIYTDEGRLMAPFIVLQDGKLPEIPKHSSLMDLISKGIIEYLDPAETETLYISTEPWNIKAEHTHTMIHPSLIFGISASSAPFANHDQAPRIIYYASMCKQACGLSNPNYQYRSNEDQHQMECPQRPILESKVMKKVRYDVNGNNLIVAVCTYTGNNQEDSVIANKNSIDNGLLRTLFYTNYSISNHKKDEYSTKICNPSKVDITESRLAGYEKLDDDGIPCHETPFKNKDMVIGNIVMTNSFSKDKSLTVTDNGMDKDSVKKIVFDNKQVYQVAQSGYSTAHQSLFTTNDKGFRSANVKTRQYRIPIIGDKLASRHAQKGIIGMILPQEDMPFSEETGITPDLIMNPNAFPSRMTTGQSIECLLSKLCCMEGELGDCTSFEKIDVKQIGDILEKNGFERHGNETLCNGMTGERMEYQIFMGPTYYQRLKHMVVDKIHSRTINGPIEILTRQPVEGRKRHGGFKIGEMETWCGISHGASNFLIDRLLNNSDKYEMYVCDLCGNTAVAHLKNKTFECIRCKQSNKISKIKIPYAFKLLQQELISTGMSVRMMVNNDQEQISN